MELAVESDGLVLEADIARPEGRPGVARPGVVLCHGFPPAAAADAAASYPELAERIASELGWVALAVVFRGCGRSQGSFSLDGWLRDVLAAARTLRDDDQVNDVWLVGFGTGGALCICAAAQEGWVRGVAALGAPTDFGDWAGHPRRLVQHAREVGLIHTEPYPTDMDAFAKPLKAIRAERCAAAVAPRAMLVVHGSDDDVVPSFDGRVLADAHGDAELALISGAEHQLRYDPRAVAILMGWLDRQRRAEFF